MKTLEFFYDFVSTYSYLASTQMDALAARTGAEIRWRPFLLGAVFKTTGNTSPINNPTKAPYVVLDATRWAEHYGVPLKVSQYFPFLSVKALRLAIVAEKSNRHVALAKLAFRAAWADEKDMNDVGVLRAIAADAGLDADRALAEIDAPDVKDALRKNTDEALARGVFGAPAFFVGDELFWGNDRLLFVEKALGGSPASR
jgi:2-hydroxychromene-2-carboxylate isomerase